MKLNEANIRFRPRTDWEAIDLGFRMVAGFRLKLALLWLLVSLPFITLITLAFWQSPGWALFFIWWCKPIFEHSTLHVLSITLFEAPPPFKTCLKKSFHLIWNKHLIGDLTWRRLSPYRSINLPIRQLEGLNGRDYKTRARLLDHQVSNGGPALTFLGANIEFILFSGVATFVWFAINANAADVFVQDFSSFMKSIDAWKQFLTQYSLYDSLWKVHLSNWLYALVLTIWGPIYVACGFSVYLNARSKLEAWDVELTFRRLAQRIGRSLLALCLVFALFQPIDPTFAEPLPDEQKINQQRDNIVNNKPYPTLKTKNDWCFLSCDKDILKEKKGSNPIEGSGVGSGLFANGFRIVMWLAIAVALIFAVYYLFRDPTWLASLTNRHKTAPKVLFGMDVTPESLPDDVGAEARKLFEKDPRAALSLLYRASLTQLIHKFDMPLRKGHTEEEVLRLIKKSAPAVSSYMETLTHHWIRMAYGHTLPQENMKEVLCHGYRQAFPLPPPGQDIHKGAKYA